jgi:hypothetical protein
MRIEIRLAHADPGRDVSNATMIFIPSTYTSAKAVYKTTDISVIPSFRSPLLSSPLLVFTLLSLYPAELNGLLNLVSTSARRWRCHPSS